MMVLHTWGQNLSQHLHVHCLVTGGALGPDGQWIAPKRGFLFPVRALSIVFRGKYLEALKGTFEAGKLDFAGETASLGESSTFHTFSRSSGQRTGWSTPSAPSAVQKRCSPTSGVTPIGSHHQRAHARLRERRGPPLARLCSWQQVKVIRLPVEEFIRRLLLHVFPKGFQRIRHYGLLANRHRTEYLAACRNALEAPVPEPTEPETVEVSSPSSSGPIPNAARIAVKDGCAPSNF